MTTQASHEFRFLALNCLKPSPQQPRRTFEPEALQMLVRSIEEHGILEPLIVRPQKDFHSIVCGERRYRAATQIGLEEVPVRIVRADDREAFLFALNENLARESLSLLEEAEAYRRLLASRQVRSQAELARLVGVSQGRISQRLSLLELPPALVDLLERGPDSGGLSERHVRALGRIRDEAVRAALTERAVRFHLTAEETEQLVGEHGGAGRRRAERGPAGWHALGKVRYRSKGASFYVRVDGAATADELARGLEALASKLREAWR